MNHEDQILELIERKDHNAIKEWVAKNPEYSSHVNDYTSIIEGFQALREEYFMATQLEPEAGKDISTLFKEAKKAEEIEKLTSTLKQHDQLLENKNPANKANNIFSINRRVLSIAASFLIIAVIGLWFFVCEPT